MNKFNAMNFDECNNAIMDLWQPEIPPHINGLLDHARVEEGATPFFVYLAALKRFIEAEKRLPISGKVPDMISTS
jgi:hypothetical protein